jgi:MFS family permease
MAEVAGRYRELFAVRGVPSLVAAMVVARIPTGCIALLLVLFVGESFGATAAGASVAAWTLGTALLAPFWGRLVDRGFGPTVLRCTAAIQLAVVAAFTVSVLSPAPVLAVAVAAFGCGATTPPVAGATRSLWKTVVPVHLLPIAYSFEILLVDVLYVSGPLVAGGFIAFGAPAWGIACTTACLAGGSVALSLLDPVKRYAIEAKCNRNASSDAGESLIRTPSVPALLLACALTMVFSGWLETLLPLFFNAQGRAFEGSLAVSVWSIGSIIGVLAFVRFQPGACVLSKSHQLVVCTGVYALACCMLAVANGWGDIAVLAIMFLIGCTVSPCTNLHYQLGGEAAPDSRHAEMFSWLNTATSAGISAGALMAGNVVDAQGFDAAFALPVMFVLASLGLSLVFAALMHRR